MNFMKQSSDASRSNNRKRGEKNVITKPVSAMIATALVLVTARLASAQDTWITGTLDVDSNATLAYTSGNQVRIGPISSNSWPSASLWLQNNSDNTNIVMTGGTSWNDQAFITYNDNYQWLTLGLKSAGSLGLQIGGSNTVGIGTNPSASNGLTVAGGSSYALYVAGIPYTTDGYAYWEYSSDGRLKDLEGEFTGGLAEVMQLQPERYRYKRDNALHLPSEGEHVGLIAQEVERVIPEAVGRDNSGYRTMNDGPVFWAMLNAIKTQETQIKAEAARIVQLAAQVRLLEAQLK